MLQLQKNSLVANVAKEQVEIRQMEVDWYCNNYSTITGQAAMLAGFAFTQLTTPMPENHETPLALEFAYLFFTCTAVGLELNAIILSTFLSVWGPSLALRGKAGTKDLHVAVGVLADYQEFVFSYFILGWVLYFMTAIMSVWIYFKEDVALVVTFPLSLFIVLILWYCYDIYGNLRVHEKEVVVGKIDAFQPYEYVADLDNGLHLEGRDPNLKEYCPLHAHATTTGAR